MKKLLLFAVLAIPAFSQFFGGGNASKIRGVNVQGPLTVSSGCSLVYVLANTRFECTTGGGAGNGIVAVTVSAATSATLTHGAALATPYIAPFVCREDTTNLPVIPATTVFTTNAIDFTFSPAFTGKCAASTGGMGGASNLTTVGSIPYVSAAGVLNQSAGLTFTDSANIRLATLAGGSSQSTNALLDVTNSAGSSHWLTVLGDGKVGVGTNAPSTLLHLSKASNPTQTMTDTTAYTGAGGAGSVFGTLSMVGSLNGGVSTNSISSVVNNSNGVSRADWVFYTSDGASSSLEKMRLRWDGTFRLMNTIGTTQTFLVTPGGITAVGLANTQAANATLSILDATPASGATATWVGHDGSGTYSGVHLSALTTSLKVVAGLTQNTTKLLDLQDAAGTSLLSFRPSDSVLLFSAVEALHVNGSTLQLNYGGGNTQAVGPLIGLSSITTSANASASTAMLLGSGTWFTGGSATTTKPYLLVEPSGTTSTGWSTSGTGIGVNAASGFAGNLLDLQVAGVTKIKMAAGGALTASDSIVTGNNLYFGGNGFINPSSDGVWALKNNVGTDFNRLQFGGTTSSFPALKRSTTGLIARLADDSADTWFQASQFRSTLTTPASAAATCTAGTIVADTGFVYVCTATDTWKRVAIATW